MSLKNKALFGGWISMALKVFRREKNMHGELIMPVDSKIGCIKTGMKKQTIYNYKNIYKLIRIAAKLMNCRVKMTYFAQYSS